MGNRIEEIIQLEIISIKEGVELNYIWNNQIKGRDYEILFSSQKVGLNKFAKQGMTIEKASFQPNYSDQGEVLDVAGPIRPSFEIYFENEIKPVGVHIRGTDRIGQDHPHFMKDETEFKSYLNKTIELLNMRNPPFVFVCADRDEYRNDVLQHLRKSIKVVKPVCKPGVTAEYRDFFALTLCKEIYMCSKFSSFSLTASLVGNIPLISFHYDEEVSNRYKALFQYEVNIRNVKSQLFFLSKNELKFNVKVSRKALQIKRILERIVRK